MTSSEEESEDEDVVDTKKPTTDNKKEDVSRPAKATPSSGSDDFLTSTGKFSFGAHDVDDTNVGDLFIPEEALKPDEGKLFVSDDDPDLLQ